MRLFAIRLDNQEAFPSLFTVESFERGSAMLGIGELQCVELKRSVASMLPGDIPWYDPSHTVFFCALYGSLAIIGFGVLAALVITIKRLKSGEDAGHH
ncbi:MAG: hypothetical protein ABFD98_01725 [Syntrophobacteraceae bacterium]